MLLQKNIKMHVLLFIYSMDEALRNFVYFAISLSVF